MLDAAGDTEEIEKRLEVVARTAARIEAGQTVMGWRKLKELLGPDVVRLLEEWLDLKRPKTVEATSAGRDGDHRQRPSGARSE